MTMVAHLKEAGVESVFESRIPAMFRVLNRVAGTILDVRETTKRILYVHTDEGGNLNLEIEEDVCASELQWNFRPGHRVLMQIDAGDVRLALPCQKSECNQWEARVVSVERERSTVTV